MQSNEGWFEPVLARIPVAADEPVPVTPHGPTAGAENNFAIIYPDGNVFAFDERHGNLLPHLAARQFGRTQSAAALKVLAMTKGQYRLLAPLNPNG